MPFAGYKNFAACVKAHGDKKDPEAYCATIMRKAEQGGESVFGTLIDMSDIARALEAALAMNTSHDELRGHLRTALHAAHNVTDSTPWNDRPYPVDVFPSHVVYSMGSGLYKRPYSVSNGTAGTEPTVKLGASKPVHRAYVDTKMDEAAEALWMDAMHTTERDISKSERDQAKSEDFAGKHRSFPILKPADVSAALHSIGRAGSDNYDSATLKSRILAIAKRKGFATPSSDESVDSTLPEGVESVREAVAFDETVAVKESKLTTIPVKIIGPGWGSMAYYSKEMLQKSGPSVYVKGTHMYWNHATESQESERPEGDLNNLAAVLTEDAKWMESGPKGPGLYSKAKVFSDYATQVNEKGAHIGISINAGIKAHEGTAEGRTGRIADAFVSTPLMSADFVTKAGAKGAPIVPVTESQRGLQEHSMDEKAQEALTKENADLKKANGDLLTRVAALEASQHEVVAFATVAAVLREAEIPFKESLLRRACTSPTMKDGKVDEAWIKAIVTDFSDGVTGRVTGNGEVKESSGAPDKATQDRLRKALEGIGVHKAGLDYAVAGRA